MLKRPESLRRLARLLCSLICGATVLSASAGAYDDLLIAARNGDVAAVNSLIARGMDPNTIDPDGNTLLMIAVQNDNPALVDVLVKARASLGRQNVLRETALALAAYSGNGTIVQRLLDAGADPEIGGWKPLHYAAFQGHAGIVQALLGKGAATDARAPNQQTALMLAARNGHEKVADLLLAAGADPTLKDGDGHTAVDIAEDFNQTDLAATLKRRMITVRVIPATTDAH